MVNTKPKILFLSASWPRGTAFGAQMRALHVCRALKEVGELTFWMVGSSANDQVGMQATKEEFDVKGCTLPVVTRNRGLKDKFRWAFDVRFLNIHGYAATSEDRANFITAASRYDIIWVFNSATASMFQIWSWKRSHLDIDDVPSTYCRTVAQNSSQLLERLKAKTKAVLLHRREKLLTSRFTTLSVCSKADRIYLGGDSRIHIIPNGFSRPPSEPVRACLAGQPRIGFIGLYSYAPNLYGVRWFLQEVWPKILAVVPNARFRLAGKDTNGKLAPKAAGVDPLGFVEDPAAEIATWSAMIVPIQFGGGTRIKIADAFSRKCPVVSTTTGAFGYDVQHKVQLFLADDPESFARSSVELINDPVRGEQMAQRAWEDFLTKWTWESIAPRVRETAEDCIRRSHDAAALAMS